MFFKHRNFSSFVRQLNLYSFRKTGVDPNCREFFNPLFRRDKPEWLPRIKRKNRNITKHVPLHHGGDSGDGEFLSLDDDGLSLDAAHAGARVVSTVSSQPRPRRQQRARSAATSGSESVGDVAEGSDDEEYVPSGSATRQAAQRPSRISVPGAGVSTGGATHTTLPGRSGGMLGNGAAGLLGVGHSRDRGVEEEDREEEEGEAEDDGDGSHPSASVEELRGGRRDADVLLRRLVDMKTRQATMEHELSVLRARDESIRMAMESNATLQREVFDCRCRMAFLMQSMQKLYLLVWHMYSSYKSNGGQSLPEHRQELEEIASASKTAAGSFDTSIGPIAGPDALALPSGSPEPVPSSSPIATSDGVTGGAPWGLGTFVGDGAIPFSQARAHWHELQGGRHSGQSKRVRDADELDADADDVDKRGLEMEPPGPEGVAPRPEMGSKRQTPPLAARNGAMGGSLGGPGASASASSQLSAGRSSATSAAMRGVSALSAPLPPGAKTRLGQSFPSFLSPSASPDSTEVLGLQGDGSEARASGRNGSNPSTHGMPSTMLQQLTADGEPSLAVYGSAGVHLLPYPGARALSRQASDASAASWGPGQPGMPASIGADLAELASQQHRFMEALATTEDRVRKAARRLQLPHAPPLDSAAVRLARASSGASQSASRVGGAAASAPVRFHASEAAARPGPAALPSASAGAATSAGSLRRQGGGGVGGRGGSAASAEALLHGSIPGRGDSRLAPMLSLARASSTSSNPGSESHSAIAGIGLDGFGTGADLPSRSMLRQASHISELPASPAADDDALSLGSLGELEDVADDEGGSG